MTRFATTALLVGMALGMTTIAAAPAAAQGEQEVGIAYQYVNFGEFDLSYPLGFNLDYSYPLTAFPLSIVGEFGFSRHSDDDLGDTFTSNLINLGVGPRYTFALDGAVTPYVQVLFGLQRDNDKLEGSTVFDFNQTNFMWQPGGGVAFPLTDTWDLFGQIDFRSVSYEDGSEWGSPRILVGGRIGL